ncbi:MAG: hypothetical protein Q4F40_02360 [Akkermansia sp.]|nr:hypothetical protein [Akkermansia sp.]
MDITPTTTPHTPEYPHRPHRAKRKPTERLSGIAPIPLFLSLPEVKSVFRHRLSKAEKELLEKLRFEQLVAGGMSEIRADYERYWPEEIFSPRDRRIAEYIKDYDWEELSRLLAPVTPTNKKKRRDFLEDYRRIYNKLRKYNPDFDSHNPLSEIVSRLTNAELQILRYIMKNGVKKTRKRLLGTTPPPANSPEAEQYERVLRRFMKVEREMQLCGIDTPY